MWIVGSLSTTYPSIICNIFLVVNKISVPQKNKNKSLPSPIRPCVWFWESHEDLICNLIHFDTKKKIKNTTFAA